MFSIENSRSKAYSKDIRWRMIHQRCDLGLSFKTIAENLNVDPSTVCRTVRLFKETSTVENIQGYHKTTTKRLSAGDEIVLLEAVSETPSVYLHELQNILEQTTGTCICVAAIYNFLKHQQFSRKKLSHRALQRSQELREKYLSEISIYDANTLVFVDETGSDRRSSHRRYGYSLKGTRATMDTLLVRGKRHSAIAAIALEGVVDVYITDQTIDGDTFCDFIEKRLLPQLLPFNGTNPRSVVVMDNASIHHVDRAVTLIEDVGAIPIFLPPYSPDVMPIEECFSKVKAFLRANDSLIQVLKESEMEDIILCAFASITPDDCYNWVEHCGYNMYK